MKQRILYIILMISALVGGRVDAWGQTTSYVLNEVSKEYELNTIEEGDAFTLSGPGAVLTFEAKKSYGFLGNNAVGAFFVQGSKDKKNWTDISEKLGLTYPDYKTYTYSISPEINYIRFVTKTGATYTKYYKNIKVTRATTLTMSEKNTLPLNMGTVKIGKSISATVNVDYNNTTYNQTLTGSCTNSAFTIESRSMGEYGTAPVTINFSPTTAGEHTGTVTLSMNGVTTSFTVTGTAQDKGTPAFTWNLSNVATNSEYVGFFSTTNEDTSVSFSSNNTAIANLVDGTLVTYDTEGSATITVTQAGNDDWHAKTETYTITVTRPQNHLPLEITESNWSILARNLDGGSFAWDGGIQHHSFAYENREFEIAFTGIPDKLSFNYRVTDSNIDNEVKWTVYEGPDGSNFTESWTIGTKKGSVEIQLKPTTRYVRIKCYCIYYENVSNIKITELRYMNTETTDINFGEHYQGDTVEPQTFVLNHCNVGVGAAVVSSNSNFVVNPANTIQTGGDVMGTEAIAVTYLNNTEGEHTGTITITDPSGKNSIPVVINVSGKTKADRLILNPTEVPNYDGRTYKQVILNRSLPQGYFTATFPFEYDINAVEGAYVAQLALVTYNQADGYTLYFEIGDGVMAANQPYVVYLPMSIDMPNFGEKTIVEPSAESITANGWTMQGNYAPGVSMSGLWGIAGGKLCQGIAGSTINAYTAYFIPPATQNVRARAAILDEQGNATYIGELKDGLLQTEEGIFGLDGVQKRTLGTGINIVRMKDGSVRKVLK